MHEVISNSPDGRGGALKVPEVSTMKGTLYGVAGGVLALFGLQFYNMHSTRVSIESRMDEMQSKIQSLQNDENTRIAELTNNVNEANERIGATSQQMIDQTQKTATALKKEQSKNVADLHNQLQTQYQEHTKAVDSLREEAVAKIEEVKKDTST